MQDGNSVISTRGITYWGIEIGWSNVTTWEYINRFIMKLEYWVTWILSLLQHKHIRLNYMFYNYYIGLCITTSFWIEKLIPELYPFTTLSYCDSSSSSVIMEVKYRNAYLMHWFNKKLYLMFNTATSSIPLQVFY